MRYIVIVWFLAHTAISLHAQAVLGARTERWAGISAVHLNPANSNLFPKKWDLQLVGAHLYTSTDYLYLKNVNFFEVIRHPEDIRAVSDTVGSAPLPADPIIFDFPLTQRRWYGVLEARLDGPGFAVRFKDKHTAGVFTATRINTNGYRIPGSLGYRFLDAVPWEVPFKSGSFHINGMAWSELGGHYSYRSPDKGGNVWGFGVNTRWIRVIQAGIARTNEAYQYIRNNRDSMSLTNGDWDIAYTNDIVNQTDANQIKPRFNGNGFALDLGFNYIIPDEESDTPDDYILQFGAAVNDLGYAHVNRNAEAHRIVFTNTTKIGIDGLNQVRNADQIIKTLSVLYLQDSTASLKGNSFSLQMPAHLNLHADYRFLPKLYVHANLAQRLPPTNSMLRSPNSLALTPRYETRWFSAFLPVVLADWQHLRTGAAMRMGVLTVGTDHLASLIGQRRWRGTDLYFLLKINAFNIKKRERLLGRKDRTWRRVGCYDL